MYQQLFDVIAERIRSGTFPAGHRLPPTRALARSLSVHRNTVVRAYEELEGAGLVQSTVGRGTFVAQAAALGEAAPAPTRGHLPWDALTSTALTGEALGRSERIGRQVSVGEVIHLNRMQASPELFPHLEFQRCLQHAMRTVGAKAMGYMPRDGMPRLRSLIVSDLARLGVPASVEDLIITTGSQQALDIVARALINPGDTFLIEEATYAGALSLLSVANARIVGVPSDGEGPDLAVLERHSRGGVKGFYLMPDCQNPLGTRISLDRREALVRWSHQAGVPLIEDDYASDLQLDDALPPPALRSLDGEVIYIGTYSKKLLPALRIGYLVCPPALHRRLSALKYAMDLGTSGILQCALAEFLERGYLVAHLARVRQEYRKRRDALHAALQKALPSDVTWQLPSSGLVMWLPTGELDPEELFQEAQRQGVLVSPGTLNALAQGAQRGLRLTYCAEPPARLVEGARRLGKAWAAVERRRKGARGGGDAAFAGI
jgi:GntR family transcriptional regulator/MocR family aminotransferase